MSRVISARGNEKEAEMSCRRKRHLGLWDNVKEKKQTNKKHITSLTNCKEYLFLYHCGQLSCYLLQRNSSLYDSMSAELNRWQDDKPNQI